MDNDTPVAKFPGFDVTTAEGFSQLYHSWLDAILQIDNLAEMKVVLYIFRHTCGFNEPDKWKYIPLDHFMHGRFSGEARMDQGTSLSENSVRHALRKAEKDGYILCKVNSRDKARIRHSYKLHFQDRED